MATPTSVERRLHARGFKKATTWGTAVALGATDEVLLKDASGIDVPDVPVISHLSSNTPFVKQSDMGLMGPVEIALPIDMYYEMGAVGRAIAMLFGTAGAPTIQGATAAYKHTFQWKDEISGLFGTYAEERPSKIFEVPSAKPYKLELNFADGMLQAVVSMRGNESKDNSSVNTATQMDALTYPSNVLESRARFSEMSVKINAESGGDVSSESVLASVSDLSLAFERPIEAGQHAAGSDKIIEPLEEGHSGPGIVINLSFSRMNSVNNAWFQTFLAGTEQKMLIELEGITIEGAYKYKFSFYFPRLKMTKPSYPAEELTRAGLTLQAEEAAAAPTGMDYKRPYLEIINQQTTDYLA